MPPTVYFVTGASRGIGFALVQQLSKRDNVLVFAGARDPSTSNQLNALAQSLPEGKVVVVKLDSVSDEDAEAAAKLVQQKADKVDVLIANAGVATGFELPVDQQSAADFVKMTDINAGGASPHLQGPRAAAVQVGRAQAPAATGYTASKPALNMIFARIHAENRNPHNMTAFVICHGHTQTDMGNEGARLMGAEQAPTKVEDSVNGILGLVDEEAGKYSCRFMSWDGAERPW
ncbi:hypothetical protein JCM3774_003259 [Rhodotorula dairenensis]